MKSQLFIGISIICLLLLFGTVSAAETGNVVILIAPENPADELVLVQSPFSGLLPVPVLISPINGTNFTHLPREMTLAWRPVKEADSYRVEISYRRGSSWIPLVIDTVAGQNTTAYPFVFAGDYPARWRVTALGTWNYFQVESVPSDWWYFSWNTRQTLTTPVQVSPGGGVVFFHEPRIMTLAWNPVPGASGYLIERDMLTGSEWNPYPDITVIGEPNSSCTFDFGVRGNGRWRVTAYDGSTYGNSTSGWWQFTFLN